MEVMRPGPNPVRLVSPSEEMGTDTPGEDHVGPRAEDGRLRAERGLGRKHPADALASDFQPPGV